MAAMNSIGRPMRRQLSRRTQFAFAAFAVLTAVASNLSAQASKTTEYQVKAAYLANFSKFVEWPAKLPKSESFNICVLGQDPFGAALDAAVAGETINRIPLAVKRISRPQDALDCRVLFISSSEDRQWKEILAALKAVSVLTVSDMREFAQRGGIVQFILDGKRVRFEVNLAATGPPGLALSSELLKLAVTVRRNP
jgi:hypothetical protein